MLGARDGVAHPSFAYPEALKSVMRARYPGLVKEWSDPKGPQVCLHSDANMNLFVLSFSVFLLCLTGVSHHIERSSHCQVAKSS